MKITAWNVNGLRSATKKGFADWLAATDADVVALQEVRALPEQLPDEVREPDGWHVHISPAEKKGYSGVGLYSRAAPDALDTSLGEERFDSEGRVQIARFGAMTIANVYFPNGSGKNRDHSRVPYKLDFYRRLFDVLQPLRDAGEPVLVVGDYNTAHREIDLARPTSNRKTSGFLDVEREELDRWLREGWVDTFRAIHGDVTDRYSWWSNRRGVREKNVGWRIDYVLASEAAAAHLVGADIHHDVMGSDHCPVSATFAPAVTGPGVGA